MDPVLKWDEHINVLSSKLNSNIYLLRLLSSSVSQKTQRIAYFALCHSIMSYAIIVWGSAASWHRVFGLQRRAVRILDKRGYRDDCRDSFKRNGILTFPCMFILECLVYVRNNLPRFQCHGDLHEHDTRNCHKLRPGFFRLTRTQKSTSCLALKFYNVLPDNLKLLPPNVFKAEVKNLLVENAFYSHEEFLQHKF